MEYLHLFNTKADHDSLRNGDKYKEPWLAYVRDDLLVTGNKGWAEKYLTFEAIESGTFSLMFDTSKTVDYSIDDGETWTQLESNTPTPTINAGENIMFKGELDVIPETPFPTSCVVSSTCRFNAMGNVYSLLYGENFENIYDITGKNLGLLFFNCANLVSAKNLSLPATVLNENCYANMFNGCTSLTAAPVLPATTLANGCYDEMFYGCTSLTAAPVLPATTLADSCYYSMFNGCTSLTAAPELPVTTLANYCYSGMFNGCTSLTTAPALPATTLTYGCYERMFTGCTSLTAAPVLPATTLAHSCYGFMFQSCTGLSFIKMLATDVSANSCLTNWVSGVASSGTFVKNSAATWNVTGINGIPTGWTVQTASA